MAKSSPATRPTCLEIPTNAMANFDQVEAQLSELLMNLCGVLSIAEQAEVRSFIDVGEYGLALETAVDILVEEKKDFPEDVLELIAALASAMSMDGALLIGRLRDLR